MLKHYKWHDQNFWLSSDRLLFWEDEKILIVSDLHIGKTGHFRKYGIAVPQDVYKEDLQRLFAALQHFQPKKLLIVGDLFHSHANKELDWFLRWRNDFSSTAFQLVKGNHDILPGEWYRLNAIDTCSNFNLNGLLMVHDMADESEDRNGLAGIISGHIHPSITVRTGPRQQVRLPCFYFNTTQCILPAFGRFTGTYSVKPQAGDEVFAISGDAIMQLSY